MRKAPPQAYGNFFVKAEKQFRRLDAIGDMILTSGFIREVRANFPHARITLVVTPIASKPAEFCPYVNEVLSLDTKIS